MHRHKQVLIGCASFFFVCIRHLVWNLKVIKHFNPLCHILYNILTTTTSTTTTILMTMVMMMMAVGQCLYCFVTMFQAIKRVRQHVHVKFNFNDFKPNWKLCLFGLLAKGKLWRQRSKSKKTFKKISMLRRRFCSKVWSFNRDKLRIADIMHYFPISVVRFRFVIWFLNSSSV